MRIQLVLAASLACGGCAVFQKKQEEPPFESVRTPAGEFCSDMKVIFNGDPEPDRPFHRVKTVRTALVETTAPERLQLLREVACKAKGDAVIDAGDYEGTAPDGKRVKFLAGTVVQWTSSAEGISGGSITPVARPAISTPTAKKAPPAGIEEVTDETLRPKKKKTPAVAPTKAAAVEEEQ